MENFLKIKAVDTAGLNSLEATISVTMECIIKTMTRLEEEINVSSKLEESLIRLSTICSNSEQISK